MTCISGVGTFASRTENDSRVVANLSSACVLGASIICADIIIRCIPSQRNFRIQDSDAFLSSSLSLSFGVMVCPSLPLALR